ncbi:MAG: MBL fold metallo-hydrolase [Alphaproteobacteria bacterium]|nr:MAG: MBL fold metallo-hydrolase [Alphaproteobacteria bacterium]
MSKAFASQADLAEKRASFTQLAPGCYAYTTEGDPNAGVIIGPDGVMVIDARATPVLAEELMAAIRTVTDLPVKYVVLTHYHAVRVMGASAYQAEQIICSQGTLDLIHERGAEDFKSEVERFPRLFNAVETVPGLTWPTLVFEDSLTLFWGGREVRILHLGAGHTKGDSVVWLPGERVLYSGDLVEWGATPYCGDAHLEAWPHTLDRLLALGPEKLVPGRGEALTTAADCQGAIEATRAFVTDMLAAVRAGVANGQTLNEVYRATYQALKPRYGDWVIFDHCLPFNVTRAVDEVQGIQHPRIWTAARDKEMWAALEG